MRIKPKTNETLHIVAGIGGTVIEQLALQAKIGYLLYVTPIILYPNPILILSLSKPNSSPNPSGHIK